MRWSMVRRYCFSLYRQPQDRFAITEVQNHFERDCADCEIFLGYKKVGVPFRNRLDLFPPQVPVPAAVLGNTIESRAIKSAYAPHPPF